MPIITRYKGYHNEESHMYKRYQVVPVGESNRIRTVPEYEHSRYLRNHKSYKKMFNE